MKPLEKSSRISIVVNELKTAIEDGKYQIAAKLPAELLLSKQLNVSRSTIRESMRFLEALGYVEFKPGKGAFVANSKAKPKESISNWFCENSNQLKELMQVRQSLEILAQSLATTVITEKQIEELSNIESQFEKSVRNKDVVRMAELDEHFHAFIVKIANNSVLSKIHLQIQKELNQYRVNAFSTKSSIHAIGPHRNIIQAIKDKDMEMGSIFVEQHISTSLEDMSKEKATDKK